MRPTTWGCEPRADSCGCRPTGSASSSSRSSSSLPSASSTRTSFCCQGSAGSRATCLSGAGAGGLHGPPGSLLVRLRAAGRVPQRLPGQAAASPIGVGRSWREKWCRSSSRRPGWRATFGREPGNGRLARHRCRGIPYHPGPLRRLRDRPRWHELRSRAAHQERAGHERALPADVPVVFISTAFVPETLMPGWMQVVAKWNPITYLIEAIRALMVTATTGAPSALHCSPWCSWARSSRSRPYGPSIAWRADRCAASYLVHPTGAHAPCSLCSTAAQASTLLQGLQRALQVDCGLDNAQCLR